MFKFGLIKAFPRKFSSKVVRSLFDRFRLAWNFIFLSLIFFAVEIRHELLINMDKKIIEILTIVGNILKSHFGVEMVGPFMALKCLFFT